MALLDTRHKDIRNLPGFGLMAALAVAFLYAPILFLVLYSFNDGRSISRLDGLSFRWYRAVFANEEIAGAALNSLALALVAASIATTMATAAALALVRMKVRRRAAAYAVLNFPLIVPEIVTAIASLIFFVHRPWTWHGVSGHRAYDLLHPLRLSAHRRAADLNGCRA